MRDRAVRALAGALFAAVLTGGEPLVCRGFEAHTALDAVTAATGRLVRLDEALSTHRTRRLWFALVGDDRAAAQQALAHALGCWWTSGGALTAAAALPPQPVQVRAYPPLAHTPPGIEAATHRLMAPWLVGDAGLALDVLSGGWTAALPPDGHRRLETMLATFGRQRALAPHLLPADDRAPLALSRPPQGSDLGAWALDLARVAGLAIALGPEVDPRSAAPTLPATTLAEARRLLVSLGVHTAVHHGCLALGHAVPVDRRHPAERASLALLPVAHLCRDEAAVASLVADLRRRVEPAAWNLPGWLLLAAPGGLDLLVSADPTTIHAVLTALEGADQTGLDAWLAAGVR